MRIVLSVVAIACVLALGWVAFTVELGPRTLVEHVRAIAGTKEAKALAAGTREEAGKVASAAAGTAAKAAHAAADSAGRLVGGVKQAVGGAEGRLPERAEGDPAVKMVDRPSSPASPSPSPSASRPGPKTGEMVGPPAPMGPPQENLDAHDRAGLDRLVKRAAR